jgi:AcrR family transcriptional regulator
MGIKERRERERDDLRGKILDAARELILEQGVEAVSMRKVADRIEYSATAIYQHFVDKESLLRAMCERDFESLHHQLREQTKDVTDPVEGIVLSGAGYVRFALRFPCHFRVMFLTPRAHPMSMSEEDQRRHGDPSMDGYAAFKLTVQAAIDAGRFRPELNDAELMTQVLWAVVHGIASLHVAKHDDPWVQLKPVDQWLRVALSSVLRGMLRDPEEIDRVFDQLATKGALL